MRRNENTTTQNLWDTVKAVLRGRFRRKQWQPTPVLLPWTEGPGGLQSMGSLGVGHN